MKTIIVCLAIATLTGCSGLNVSWVATASYNTCNALSNTAAPCAAPVTQGVAQGGSK